MFVSIKIDEWSNHADLLSQLPTVLSFDVKDDWQTQPFSDILVTNHTYCPESHPDLVFDRPFYGTIPGCECYGNFDDWMYTNDGMGRH